MKSSLSRVAVATFALGLSSLVSGQSSSKRVSVDDVIRMTKAKVGEELVIEQIHRKGAPSLSTDELIRLKSSAVSDRVIKAMMESSASHAALSQTQPKPAPIVTTPVQAQRTRTQQSRESATPRPSVVQASYQQPTQWTTHHDPSGFSVDVPRNWRVQGNKQQGRITVLGNSGEQVTFWLMLLPQRQLDARSAGTIVQQLARRLDPQMPWGAADSSTNFVRVVARGQRKGATLMTWKNSNEGAALYVYSVEAPAEVYHASSETLASILKSFRVDSAPTNSSAVRQTAQSGPLNFARWADPHENAFTLSVPQGWQVQGGAYRLTATDVRKGVSVISPDSQVRVFEGDANIGVFSLPNAIMAQYGFREGSSTTIGDGTRLVIRRYMQAQQFLNEYAQSVISRQCSGLRVGSSRPRQDRVDFVLRPMLGKGQRPAQASGAEVSFTCTLNGHEAHGLATAVTVLVQNAQIGLWFVDDLNYYLTPADREREAAQVFEHVTQSYKIDPQWEAREAQIAGAAVQQDNYRSQQIRDRALRAIQEDQRQTSEIITRGYEARSRVYDEISRKRENAILGKVDVVDPNTGAQYKIDNYSDYHWMSDTGYVAGTRTANSPGPGWHQMIDLP